MRSAAGPAFGEESFGAGTGAEAMLYALGLTNATYYRMFITDAEHGSSASRRCSCIVGGVMDTGVGRG